MLVFRYDHIKEITLCTALPAQKKRNKNSKSIAVFEQTTSDLGFLAAKKIIKRKNIDTKDIGALIFLTKTPDYRGPATAMVLQNRLEIPYDCIVYDSPTGNFGFENGVNLGASLLKSISQNYALVVFGDTISKQLSDKDIIESSFQDGATAVLLEKGQTEQAVSILTIALTKNWSSFMVPSGGFRNDHSFFNKLSPKKEHQLETYLHIDKARIENSILPEFSIIKNEIRKIIFEQKNPNIAIIINLINPELEKQLHSILIAEDYVKDVYLSTEYIPQTMASTVPLVIEKAVVKKNGLPVNIISVSLGEGLSLNISKIEVSEALVLETIISDDFFENGFVTHEL